jgi:hypothetical protein
MVVVAADGAAAGSPPQAVVRAATTRTAAQIRLVNLLPQEIRAHEKGRSEMI